MPQPRIFFTSDTHFGDPRTFRVRKRPFASVSEMDEAMIANWNATVQPGDTIYHLGDVCYRDCREPGAYIERLNGEIHLIEGNQDAFTVELAGQYFASIETLRELDWKGWRFVLFHYPMRDWPYAARGACHLYGHVHGALDAAPYGRSLDVGVESHGFAPVSIERVAEILAARPQHSGGLPPAA